MMTGSNRSTWFYCWVNKKSEGQLCECNESGCYGGNNVLLKWGWGWRRELHLYIPRNPFLFLGNESTPSTLSQNPRIVHSFPLGWNSDKCQLFWHQLLTRRIYIFYSLSTMSMNDFEILAKLGEGAYSSVYKVKRLVDESIYALKKVKLVNLSNR